MDNIDDPVGITRSIAESIQDQIKTQKFTDVKLKSRGDRGLIVRARVDGKMQEVARYNLPARDLRDIIIEKDAEVPQVDQTARAWEREQEEEEERERPAKLEVGIFANPQRGVVPLTVSFDCRISGGLDPYKVTWTVQNERGDADTFKTERFKYTWQKYGQYQVSLGVSDASRQFASESIIIYVDQEPGSKKGPPKDAF
jgi:hypothetical protein